MEVILKRNRQTVKVDLTIIEQVTTKTNQLLVGHLDDGSPFFVPVLFLANCKIKGITESIVGAFYTEGADPLRVFFLGEIPDNLDNNDNEEFYLIDYKQYVETCQLMNKTALPIIEYVKLLDTEGIALAL